MSDSDISEPIKLLARNAPAIRKTQAVYAKPRLVVGNPISTRLESGIGNCFPGLECDLRNLERRFFPFLETDVIDNKIALVSVDIAGVEAARKKKGAIDEPTYRAYRALAAGGDWTVKSIKGTFGPLKTLQFEPSKLRNRSSTGEGRLPINAWTAVRLLTEGTDVFLTWHKRKPAATVDISGKRARYLNDDGALADMFAPGELTQSLCSPWTHDFRDCACFYWASNHPDIALPPLPSEPTTDPKWYVPVPWERRDRTLNTPPKPATNQDPTRVEMRYYEINRVWQKLNFVIEGREQSTPYAQRAFLGTPLPDDKTLETHLRYAAGVELAVLHEYLAAAYSLKPDGVLNGRLRDDVRATRAELMRIALGEMRHLRGVNTVLASLLGRPNYEPALGIATLLPGGKLNKTVAVLISAFTLDAQQRFIDIEKPSEAVTAQTVDGLYANILATLVKGHPPEDVQAVRTIMTEGEDHYRTFLALQEWLKPHKPATYLRSEKPKPAPKNHALNQTLQREYVWLLDKLYSGYKTGLPDGALDVNAARNAMVSRLDKAADDLTDAGFLLALDLPANDARFKPVAPPPSLLKP